MRRLGLRVFAVILETLVLVASALPATQQQKPRFTFHSNAWLNLHQFVRLVARGISGAG